ncbi:MAG: hypothetical protein AB7Q17_03750 [Phycisphaerae bacterium]
MIERMSSWLLLSGVVLAPMFWLASPPKDASPQGSGPFRAPTMLDVIDYLDSDAEPDDGGLAGGANEPSFIDAVSREYSFLNEDAFALAFADAISREYSFLNEDAFALAFADAVSREYSFLNEDAFALAFSDAVSREFSFQNETTVYTTYADAVSREYSFQNGFEQPDLQFSALSAGANRYVGQSVTLSWTVSNQGIGVAFGDWIDRVYVSSDDVFDPSPAGADALVAQVTNIAAYGPDEAYVATANVNLPSTPGAIWFFVFTDALSVITEEVESNNVGVLPLGVLAPEYGATVSADPSTAPAGTPVVLSGQATRLSDGVPAGDVPVEIRIVRGDVRRVVSVMTDSAGSFSYTFEPLAQEAGIYEVSADHPAVQDAAAEDSFALYGMTVEPAALSLVLRAGQPRTGTLTLRNLGVTPLTMVAAEIVDLPPTVTLQLTLPAGLPPLSRVPVPYTALATSDTVASATPQVNLSSAEAATAHLSIALTIPPTLPRFEASVTELSAAMIRGEQTMVEFRVTNTGAVSSGPVTVDPPNPGWLHLATPAALPPLPAGGSATVVLRLAPPDDLPLGPYTGTIALFDAQASLSVPFAFRCASVARGNLRVTATDEASYFDSQNGFPNVAGAALELRDPYDDQLVATGVTDAAGQYVFADVVEGRYELHASAPDHGAARVLVDVEADTERDTEVFLPREYVSYRWRVEPTTTEDRYRINLEAVFETYVPPPYLDVTPRVVDMRDMLPGEVRTVIVTIRNVGHVNVTNAAVAVHGDAVAGNGGGGGGHPDYDLEPLVEQLGVISPGASIDLPVAVRASPSFAADPPCYDIRFEVRWEYFCGRRIARGVAVPFLTRDADCTGSPVPTYCHCGGGGGGGGGTIYVPPGIDVPQSCDPCQLNCALAIGEVILGYVPILGCVWNISNACHGLLGESQDLPTAFGCVIEVAGCVPLGRLIGDLAEHALEQLLGAYGQASSITSIVEACICLAGRNGAYAEWRPFDPITTTSDDPLVQFYIGRANRYFACMDFASYPYGNPVWFQFAGTADWERFQQFSTTLTAAADPMSDAGVSISAAERDSLVLLPLPAIVTPADAELLIERLNRTVDYWSQGIFTAADVPPGMSTDFIDREVARAKSSACAAAADADMLEGFSYPMESLQYAAQVLYADRTEVREGVCARVRIRISQDAVLSRAAFAATLELDNAGDIHALENVLVELFVQDETGVFVPERFDIRTPRISGGISAVDGTQALAPGTSVAANWTIVPGDDAAPTEPRRYAISGRLSYVLDGETVATPLLPVNIDVLPNARLHLEYFHERIVYSDDPFTPDVVEPARPFALGVLVHNAGAGVAQNLRITSAQPEVIDNRDGLLINFTIIGTQIGSDLLSPSLTVNLGDIEPLETVSARWLMTASLQGEFREYSASFEHVDGLGDPRFSLFETIHLRPMVHSVRADWPTDDMRPDFLTDDVPDLMQLPDHLHTSTNEVLPVAAVIDATTDGPVAPPGDFDVTLTADCAAGWNYIRADDPGLATYRLARVRRADGSVVRGGDNAWTTNRVVRVEGLPPRVEQYVHVFDHVEVAGVRTYQLHYTTSPAVVPGDVNCDGGSVDNFDIDAFILAITNADEYEATFPWCDINHADINLDGRVDNFDIDSFVALLIGG